MAYKKKSQDSEPLDKRKVLFLQIKAINDFLNTVNFTKRSTIRRYKNMIMALETTLWDDFDEEYIQAKTILLYRQAKCFKLRDIFYVIQEQHKELVRLMGRHNLLEEKAIRHLEA